MYCKKCGSVVHDNVSFCPVCGAMAQNKEKVGMLEATKLFFTRYVDFEGRSRRSEYWWANLMIGLIGIVLGMVLPMITGLWSLAILIPSIAICVRRLHDIGKSGWWYLINLIPLVGQIIFLVWTCKDSTADNRWGPNPKIVSAQPVHEEQQRFDFKPAPAQLASPAPVPPAVTAPMQLPVTAAVKAPVRAALVVKTGPMAGKGLYCEEGKNVTVGRDPNRSNLGLPDYRSVSGLHCRIVAEKQYVSVTDLGSTNGTYVDGKRLTPNVPVAAKNGSLIQLADSNCILQVRMN